MAKTRISQRYLAGKIKRCVNGWKWRCGSVKNDFSVSGLRHRMDGDINWVERRY